MTSPLRVKGLESAIHDTAEYVLIPMYIPTTKEDGTKILCRIHREIHLVNNLKAHMLLSNDVIGSEKIVLDISQSKVYIDSCGVIAIITSRQRDPYQRRVIHARKPLIIAPRFDAMVSIDTPKGLSERDFIFEPVPQRNLIMYAHLMDSRIADVLVKNEIDNIIQIPKRLRLDMLCEIDYENMFFAEAKNLSNKNLSEPSAIKVSHSRKVSWIKKAAIMAIAASISLAGSLSQLINVDQADIIKVDNVAGETRLSNDVMVYDNSHETKILSDLMKKFPTLWKDEGFVNISEEN